MANNDAFLRLKILACDRALLVNTADYLANVAQTNDGKVTSPSEPEDSDLGQDCLMSIVDIRQQTKKTITALNAVKTDENVFVAVYLITDGSESTKHLLNPDNHVSKAHIWMELNECPRAIAEMDHAIEREPDHSQHYSDRGFMWSTMNDSEKAMRDYDTALDIDPSNTWALVNRGNEWKKRGEPQYAEIDHLKAVELGHKEATSKRT